MTSEKLPKHVAMKWTALYKLQPTNKRVDLPIPLPPPT